MSELIYTHISLRFPGPTPMYLLNPHGMLFHDITASSLVKIDFTGNVAADTRTPPTGTEPGSWRARLTKKSEQDYPRPSDSDFLSQRR